LIDPIKVVNVVTKRPPDSFCHQLTLTNFPASGLERLKTSLARWFVLLGAIGALAVSGTAAGASQVIIIDPAAESIRAAAESELQRILNEIETSFEQARHIRQFQDKELQEDLGERLFENLPFGSLATTREIVLNSIAQALSSHDTQDFQTVLKVMPKETALELLRSGQEIKGLKFDSQTDGISADFVLKNGRFALPIVYLYDKNAEPARLEADLGLFLNGMKGALTEAIEANADFELFEFLRQIANQQINAAKSLAASEPMVRTAIVDYTAFMLTRTYVGVVAANRYLGSMLTRSDFKTAEIDIVRKQINGAPATDQNLRLPVFLMLIEARNVAGPGVIREIEEYLDKNPASDALPTLADYVKSRCRLPANEVVRAAIRKSVP
jgi:predicted RNA methylase